MAPLVRHAGVVACQFESSLVVSAVACSRTSVMLEIWYRFRQQSSNAKQRWRLGATPSKRNFNCRT